LSKANITGIHKEIIEEMINEALKKAAESMGKMLRIRMSPELINYGEGELTDIRVFDDLGRFKVNLMKVAFKGEINGAFYFIINTPEMELINKVCLPADVTSSRTSENKMMKHDFMTEIENLIASQSITALSDFLGVQLLGEVPIVRIIKGELVNKYLENENKNIKTRFFVKSNLHGIAVNISPYFIWMIDENFMKMSRLNIVT
jgi:chemotaxis protein CheY-P-specific phosphatase CheC